MYAVTFDVDKNCLSTTNPVASLTNDYSDIRKYREAHES